ncbi:PDDEXK nuclease domain-containing protein [Candidatus Uabimicrobium sp. HlEnr_7]|uniref:PDDEXK nuclease domain-containing protein n=1 Tax=Candidatus Uabimicrobium helgolandensis TaxID=3095367 RepID=UPI003557BAD6
MSFSNNHYYIDLLLYNRILKSLVLIDLKIRDFKPEDAGQMNFYLNYCKEHEVLKGENEPVGLILCAGKDEVMVEYAFGSFENQIYAAEYRLVLPSEEILKKEISNYKSHISDIIQNSNYHSSLLKVDLLVIQ